jgi:uncharacterized membrane protein
MTLVEVLAALVLLGSMLVVIVIGRNRLIGQYHAAQRRQAAVQAAERLLADWWKDPTRLLPRSAQGPVDGADHLQWRTQVVPQAAADQLGGQVVRLQMIGQSPQDRRVQAEGLVLLSVDVVVAQ